MKKLKFLATLASVLFLTACGTGVADTPPIITPVAGPETIETPTNVTATGSIVLSTTTSTYDSGLLDFLLPIFTQETGIDVRVISVGTGAAFQLGRDREADVVLAHARVEEDRFVAEGYSYQRHDIMYNDFVLVGPYGTIDHNNDIVRSLRYIYENNLPFVSRGDNSGTHIRELQLWEYLGIDTFDQNTGYLEVGQGMGATLMMTVEMDAFTISDRSTWLFSNDHGNLTIVTEGHQALLNPYGILKVKTAENPDGANVFIEWMIGERGQYLISIYGVNEFGSPLFFPEAE